MVLPSYLTPPRFAQANAPAPPAPASAPTPQQMAFHSAPNQASPSSSTSRLLPNQTPSSSQQQPPQQPPEGSSPSLTKLNDLPIEIDVEDLLDFTFEDNVKLLHVIEYFFVNIYERVAQWIGLDNWVYQGIITFLAFTTFLLAPLNIATNYYFSYRIDPAKFFNRYSHYDYAKTYTGFTLFSFWTHKISTIVWTCAIIIHVLIITIYGTKFPQQSKLFHKIMGASVAVSSFSAALFGLIVMQQHDARYNSFTQFFLLFPSVIVFISSPAIIVLRTIPQLKAYKPLHAIFGFFLLLPPLAMMIQFLTYSTLLATQDCSDEFKCWQASMYVSCFLGIIMEVLFSFHAYYFGRVRLYRRLMEAANAAAAATATPTTSSQQNSTVNTSINVTAVPQGSAAPQFTTSNAIPQSDQPDHVNSAPNRHDNSDTIEETPQTDQYCFYYDEKTCTPWIYKGCKTDNQNCKWYRYNVV